jgi:hypothetical protein
MSTRWIVLDRNNINRKKRERTLHLNGTDQGAGSAALNLRHLRNSVRGAGDKKPAIVQNGARKKQPSINSWDKVAVLTEL